jgi:hypothetical protein
LRPALHLVCLQQTNKLRWNVLTSHGVILRRCNKRKAISLAFSFGFLWKSNNQFKNRSGSIRSNDIKVSVNQVKEEGHACGNLGVQTTGKRWNALEGKLRESLVMEEQRHRFNRIALESLSSQLLIDS